MARYIDADALKERLKDFSKRCRDGRKQGVDFVLDCVLPDISTADVASRSEVEALEKEIDRLKNILDYYALQYGTVKSQQQVIDRAKSEVAREIFEEIDKRFETLLESYPCNGEFEDAKSFVNFHWKYIRHSIMRDYDAELKQKYTEGEDEKGKM